MKRITILIFFISGITLSCDSQVTENTSENMTTAAIRFLKSLSPVQKSIAQFTFTNEERYTWHYVPIERKGIPVSDMTAEQQKFAFEFLHIVLSDTGFTKTRSIMELEKILKEVENRPANDHHRDPEKYYFSFFGDPAFDNIWGWRFEGHHVAYNFSSENKQLVSATPSFLGTNPAMVLSGPEKGKQVLKDETELGFALLYSLDAIQMKKAIINELAPAEILTGDNRKAMINDTKGILYNELNSEQQKRFVQLLSLYIHRYTRLFAVRMMNDIEKSGLNNVRFAWAGAKEPGVGHPHYYRIQGPTIIIEYDNIQNDANHVHTVIRDLTNDFGGDELLNHYYKVKH